MKMVNRLILKKFQSFWPFFIFLIIFSVSSTRKLQAQNPVLDVGFRFQKSVNLYFENGITAKYTNERLFSRQLYFGVSYVSSRLGTAMGTNAIKQDNYMVYSAYYFRSEKRLRPYFQLNTGYFYADYEEEVFDDLPNSSIILSPEAGLSFRTNFPLKISASLGYNLITGDGERGPGTLYPLFLQTSVTWDLFKTIRNEKDL
jgi:hypothetical protein